MRQREIMSHLKLSLVLLLLVTISAEEKSSSDDVLALMPETVNEAKPSEKRWTQDYQSYQPQPAFSKELPTSNLRSETKGQERTKEEKTFKDFLGYEAIQSVLINALKPKPILDTAEESEKLAPNDGSKTQPLGDFIVRGTETLSRALNTVIDVPKKAINKLSAGATQALNQLGAYLIGL